MMKREVWKRFRSAISGRFVARWFADRNPTTTISERVSKKDEPDA